MFQVGDLVVPNEFAAWNAGMYQQWLTYMEEHNIRYFVVNKVDRDHVYLDMLHGSTDYRAALFRHYAATPVALASLYVVQQLKAG